ncbi:MAG: C69 family dipeptidase [Tannerellaceae bacterium]|nr:C69 family dipeptidase [Tannerellaceae bacterium]
MNKTPLLLFFLLAFGIVLKAAEEHTERPAAVESCTSIMVGRKASADGSVMTSHTCDGNYRTWMNIVPSRAYAGDTVTPIYSGRLHTDFTLDGTGLTFKGNIPQAASTYSFLNTAYPCLNERQLGIGETTITGRRELINPGAMFMIEELERIALERCVTAREAILLIGGLVREYGYADAGECLTIADKREVWHFEIFGEGKDVKGGVWAAVRIPDNHVGVSANIPRIGAINILDSANCLASDNVFEAARRLGYWDGKGSFSFWKAYGGGKKAFAVREYFVLTRLAPGLGLSFDSEELPLSVKPEKAVSAADVMSLLRQTYEGTAWDMTAGLTVETDAAGGKGKETVVSPSANPWMTSATVAMLNGIRDSVVVPYRLIAVPQCSYSHVIQLRDWLPDAIGGVAWMSFDNPGQSPRFPVFCGAKNLPVSFGICGQHIMRDDATVWYYRKANKLATVRWGMTKDLVMDAVRRFEDKGRYELPLVEARYAELRDAEGEDKAASFLDNYTADFVGATALRWKELENVFWAMFARGF